MSHQILNQSITYLDNAGNDREEEVSLEFSPHGLTDKGTFILYESPSDAEEQLIDDYQADWAIEYRFEDFAAQVDCWSTFQAFIESIKDCQVGEVFEALNFLQGNDYSANAIYAYQLPLLQRYAAWKQQQALLANVPTTTKPAKTTIKI